MDGVSDVTSLMSGLSQAETATAVQVKVLDEAMEMAGDQVLSLLQSVGNNVDTHA